MQGRLHLQMITPPEIRWVQRGINDNITNNLKQEPNFVQMKSMQA